MDAYVMAMRRGAMALVIGSVACGTARPPLAAAPPSVRPSAAPSAPIAAQRVPDSVRAAVNAADRSQADRALDGQRKPELTLAFFGILPGMRVAEVGVGAGYTSELLARAVGPSGRVYGQNPPRVSAEYVALPWSQRLEKPALANVVRVDRPFEDPLPPDATNLDAVLVVLAYHDIIWMGVDREQMNRAIFAALKPGGIYGIVDQSAAPGTGFSGAFTLHRIDEKTLCNEVERVGFRFASEGQFVRNPEDTRDWRDAPAPPWERRGSSAWFVSARRLPSQVRFSDLEAWERRGTSDRFVLEFKKP